MDRVIRLPFPSALPRARQQTFVRERCIARGPMCLLAIAATMLAGCQSMETSAVNSAQVRVIAASPDTASMDFYAGSSALAYGVEFGAASSYVSLPAGSNVRLAATTANSAQTLVTASAGFVPGRHYTAVVSNLAASLQETIYSDQTQPASAGQIAVRIIDAAARAGAVDVYLVPDGGTREASMPLRTALGFGASTGYIQEPVGTYSLLVVPAGAEPSSSEQTLLTGPQANYAPGAVVTIVLVDHQKSSEKGIDEIVADDFQPS